MYSPTTRLLTILEILQSRNEVSGPELAATLEVDVRSVRRYVTMLRDMGIPVESEPGRFGMYYLRPGFRLPPLMFTGGEILAIIMGLMAVRHVGLSGTLAVESAIAKIERVLPDMLRERARAVQAVLTFNIPGASPPPDEILTGVSLAAHQRSPLWMVYRGGEETERVVDVYGLVYHSGFWYAVGYCHLREDLRIFRLDRIGQIRLLEATFEPPADFDALTYLLDKIASLPGTWMMEVLLKTTLEAAQTLVPRYMAILESVEGGVLLRTRAEDLDWAARFLVGLGFPFTVIQPPELRDALRRLAQSIVEMADSEYSGQQSAVSSQLKAKAKAAHGR